MMNRIVSNAVQYNSAYAYFWYFTQSTGKGYLSCTDSVLTVIA